MSAAVLLLSFRSVWGQCVRTPSSRRHILRSSRLRITQMRRTRSVASHSWRSSAYQGPGPWFLPFCHWNHFRSSAAANPSTSGCICYACRVCLQRAMAKILTEELGELLFIPEPKDMGATWLSPEQLRNKVQPAWTCT